MDEHEFASSLHQGKSIGWINQVFITRCFAYRQDLQFLVQGIQFVIFISAHCLILLIFAYIFLLAGQEQLQWLHWKFDIK